jgi:hypothetical protein
MRIKGISEQDLRAAVKTAGAEFYDNNLTFNRHPEKDGNWLHFTLRVHDSKGPGAGRSASHFNRGRRLISACWHAHRDVMRAIFKLAPDALLITALARYEGTDGFEHEFPMTGTQNVGPPIDPIARQDCCECYSGDY